MRRLNQGGLLSRLRRARKLETAPKQIAHEKARKVFAPRARPQNGSGTKRRSAAGRAKRKARRRVEASRRANR